MLVNVKRCAAGPVETQINLQHIDTSKYMVFKFDKILYTNYKFDKHAESTTLSDNEIRDIEEVIRLEAIKYNKRENTIAVSVTKRTRKMLKDTSYIYRGGFLDSTLSYYKQFIPVINHNGEKEVFISCFCSADQKLHWREFLILPDGGGSCFFRLRVNLTKRKVLYFEVNAPL